MTIRYEVLGQPDSDNALWVEVDSGQQILRLLFDCGDQCLTGVPFGQIQKLDHVFFSHFHMDHISGFDALFRCVYGRDEPIHFWGPGNAAEILGHRFQGFWWNLVQHQAGAAFVNSLSQSTIQQHRFELAEGFAVAHHVSTREFDEVPLDQGTCTVRSIELEHQGISLGYRIDEAARVNVSVDALAELGLPPGPWLKELKERAEGQIRIGGTVYGVEDLRDQLVTETEGDSVAYLTDFLLDQVTKERLVTFLAGCQTVIIEAQYQKDDLDLAIRNHHTTTDQVSRLAAEAGVDRLILFHLSERYSHEQWEAMLRQTRSNFPNTHFPEHWFPGRRAEL